MEILGVDFSGAQADNNTWLAQGLLDCEGLTLRCCRAVSRGELTEILANLAGPSVAALDFPFSVPMQFAHYWQPEAKNMPDLWASAARIEWDEFIVKRNAFVNRPGKPKREPKRQCDDKYYREAFSPLHDVNPNMVPMTFRGMQMLARLWPYGFIVPPLAPPPGAQVTLLEAMPGATLKALCLRHKGYKTGLPTREPRRWELRRKILDELPHRSGLPMPNLDQFREKCLRNHDCLDAVVAAVTAALWIRDRASFRHPPKGTNGRPDPVALLEGWLYAPDPTLTLPHPEGENKVPSPSTGEG